MISKLNEDMEIYLNKCLDALKTKMVFQSSLPKNGAYSSDYWIAKLDDTTKQKLIKIENKSNNERFGFYNKCQRFINKYKNGIAQMPHRHELTFIEIHLFINSLVLMAIDGCCSIGVGLSCFVSVLTFMSFCFSCFLWYHYIRNTERNMTEEMPETLAEQNLDLTIRYLKCIAWRVTYCLICIFVLCFISGIWTFVYLGCMILFSFFMCYKHCDNMLANLNHYKYTNSLVIKHTVFHLLTAFIVAIIVKTFISFDYIHKWSLSGHDFVLKCTQQWEENILLFFNCSYIGSVYMIYLLSTCFIAPLIIGYVMNRCSSRKVLLRIQKEQENVKKSIADYQQQYRELIDAFIKKESE